MIPVVTPEQMRVVDASAGQSVEALVGRAGEAVARAAVDLLGGTYGRTVTVLAGPGNNGADGRVAAERLAARGLRTYVVDVAGRPASELVELPPSELVIDAAYGTGFRVDREGRAPWSAPGVGRIPVLAVDIPSGLDGLTGVAAEGTLPATATVTFGALKPGHLLGRGPDLCGELQLAAIGLSEAVAALGGPPMGVVTGADVRQWVPPRGRTDHKWVSAVRVVAGSAPMRGAASLCAAAAHRAGAGLVVLSVPGGEGRAPVEVIDRPIPTLRWTDDVLADLHRFRAMVVGPGLGRDDDTRTCVADLVARTELPMVIDGDGLAALPWNPEGSLAFLRERRGPVVLTPHDGEFALLTGTRPGVDRVADAHRLCETTGAVVLLKGPATIIADPNGATYFVTNGDERLATAGTGDVLAGVIAALLARGAEPARAAAAGAWLHAAAAANGPPRGLVASDLLLELPGVMP